MLTRKQYVLVKIEGTPGEDAEPDLSNRIEAANEFSPSPYEGDTVTRDRFRDHLGGFAEVNVGPYSTLSITVPAAGSGSAGTAPSYGALLRACGLSETTGSGIVTYQPVSENFETATIYFVLDGQLHKMTNCIGSPTYNFEAADFPSIQFEMMGVYHRPTQVGNYSGTPQVQPAELPVNPDNSTISVHGFSTGGQTFSLNQNNSTTHRVLIGDEDFRITDRDSNGTVQIDAPDIATKNYFEAVESHNTATYGAIQMVHGTTSGNIITINEPRSQLSGISVEDSEGVVQYSMTHKALPVDGDDEFTLEFS